MEYCYSNAVQIKLGSFETLKKKKAEFQRKKKKGCYKIVFRFLCELYYKKNYSARVSIVNLKHKKSQ